MKSSDNVLSTHSLTNNESELDFTFKISKI